MHPKRHLSLLNTFNLYYRALERRTLPSLQYGRSPWCNLDTRKKSIAVSGPVKEYDVFISHAYEDKVAFADGLADALRKKKLRVWYSGFELKVGDSITGSVNSALANSAYGIVIISNTYLEKQWAMSELKALFTYQEVQNRILPVLLGVSVEEVRQHIPLLADRYAVSADKGMQEVVNRIMQTVKGKRRYTRKDKKNPVPPADHGKDTPAVSNSGIMVSRGGITINGGQLAGGNIINNSKERNDGDRNIEQ